MSRWRIAGIVTLLFLTLLAFTIVDSCRQVNEPTRMEEDPETLDMPEDSATRSSTPSSTAVLRVAPLQQVTV
jgi:hypothetical protein